MCFLYQNKTCFPRNGKHKYLSTVYCMSKKAAAHLQQEENYYNVVFVNEFDWLTLDTP